MCEKHTSGSGKNGGGDHMISVAMVTTPGETEHETEHDGNTLRGNTLEFLLTCTSKCSG